MKVIHSLHVNTGMWNWSSNDVTIYLEGDTDQPIEGWQVEEHQTKFGCSIYYYVNRSLRYHKHVTIEHIEAHIKPLLDTGWQKERPASYLEFIEQEKQLQIQERKDAGYVLWMEHPTYEDYRGGL
jgi:hypothetical protein